MAISLNSNHSGRRSQVPSRRSPASFTSCSHCFPLWASILPFCSSLAPPRGQRYANGFTLKRSSTGIRAVSERRGRVAFSVFFFSHIPPQLFIVAFQVGTGTLGCDAAQEEADKKQVAPAATDTEAAQTNGMLNFPPTSVAPCWRAVCVFWV